MPPTNPKLPPNKGFPVSVSTQDILNQALLKREALSVRREQPSSVDYQYTEKYMYRGVPIQLIEKITVTYESTKPSEIFVAIRDEVGNLLRTEMSTDWVRQVP